MCTEKRLRGGEGERHEGDIDKTSHHESAEVPSEMGIIPIMANVSSYSRMGMRPSPPMRVEVNLEKEATLRILTESCFSYLSTNLESCHTRTSQDAVTIGKYNSTSKLIGVRV